jgi:hypothetical protein
MGVDIDDELAARVHDSPRDPLLPSLIEMGSGLPGKSRHPRGDVTSVTDPSRAELYCLVADTPQRIGDMLREAFRPELSYYSDPHLSALL